MSQPYEDPTRFLVDDDAEVVTIDLTTGLTADQARRRQLEREIRHTIKTLVHDTRTSSALSQVAAAKCWGAEQPQVSRLERDPGNAHVATLLSYLNALGAHVEIRVRTGDDRSGITILDDHAQLDHA
jgi:predicted XRE-type DNA-binding protein